MMLTARGPLPDRLKALDKGVEALIQIDEGDAREYF